MTLKEEFLKSCFVVDTETTSDDYKTCEIIESGFAIRNETTNKDWIMYQELHKPTDGLISPKVQSICYIVNEMVADKLPFVENKQSFQHIVDAYKDGYVVAHNYFYDMKVLQRHGIELPKKSICTWRIAKKIFQSMPEIQETNLPYLRFALNLDVPLELLCHRAGNDSYITAKLLEFFVGMMEEMGIIDQTKPYGPQIEKYSNSPIIYERMPFGKYKNELMTSIPASYWQWSMKNTQWFDNTADNYDLDLHLSIEKAIESQ